MQMLETIKEFNKQFEYKPKIVNFDKLGRFDKFVIAGMGGSNLTADLLKIRAPKLDIIVHRNYGLPEAREEYFNDRLFILSSFSGNTEETIDAFEKIISKGLPLAVVSSGGKLIELAEKNSIPYILISKTGIQPRLAVGYNMMAILKIMRADELFSEAADVAKMLDSGEFENSARVLAEKLKGRIPVIYSSFKNAGIARNWKIKFNETAKAPAFYNLFPELNHNEMTGFSSKDNLNNFHFIFIRDKDDHPRILKRMEVTKKIYEDRGFGVDVLDISGKNVFYKIFLAIIMADWTAYYLASLYGVNPDEVPVVEEFKKLIA